MKRFEQAIMAIMIAHGSLSCQTEETEKTGWALRTACAWMPRDKAGAGSEREKADADGITPVFARRWQWVPQPAETAGNWRVRGSLDPVLQEPRDREPGALLPCCRSTPLEVLPAHRLTLAEIDMRVRQIPASARVAAVVMDDDELARLAPLGERVVSLAVQGGLQNLAALSAFPNLEALSLRITDELRIHPVKLEKLQHLEIGRVFGARISAAFVLDAMGTSPAVLRELMLTGEIENADLERIAQFPFLETLTLDFIVPEGNLLLDRAGPLCRLRELEIRAGRGLFPAIWAWAAAHPNLKALSARSLSHEPVRAATLPFGLHTLRLAGKIGDQDLEILSHADSLRHLELEDEIHLYSSPETDNLTDFPFENPPAIPGVPVDLEPLRRLRLEVLSLQGDFRLPRHPLATVRRLRWVTGIHVTALDFSEWTTLQALELVLQSVWALRLPNAGQLQILKLQDLSDPPLQLKSAAVAAALTRQAQALHLEMPGLTGDMTAPGTVRHVILAGPAAGPQTLSQLAAWKPQTLEIRASPAETAIWQAFFRNFPETLRRVRLFDVQAARGEDWVWEGPPYPGPPDFLGSEVKIQKFFGRRGIHEKK